MNDDSFSGDGTLEIDAALKLARHQAELGADVIDIGAESARTNRPAVNIEEEVRRFSEFLERWSEVVAEASPKDGAQIWPPVLSANTWRSEVVEQVLPMGVELLNDMSGLPDGRNAELCAGHVASLLIMHSVGEPKVPHLHQQWVDVMDSMECFFAEKIKLAMDAGVSREGIILDPGIDFAKQRDDNLTVLNGLDRLRKFDRPVLVPVSRKTVIGDVLDLPDPRERDAGTVALIGTSVRRGAQILRVHDVRAAWQAVKVLGSF